MFLFFFITGLITSAFLNGYLFEFFSKRKLYDPINIRSSHNEKATRSGGAAIFLTLCFCYGVGRAFLLTSLFKLASLRKYLRRSKRKH